MKNRSHGLSITFLDLDDIKNPLLAAGQARATLEVGQRMVQMGQSITVICSRYPKSKDRKENGIQYKHIGIGTKNIRLNNLIYILVLPLSVVRIRCDIIVECFTAPVSTVFTPLFTRIPVVALPTSFEAERFSKLYHFPTHKIEHFGLRFYKYFLPFTKDNLQKMQKHNKNVYAKIVPQGVGKSFLEIKKNNPRYILFLGRLDIGQKGLDLLLEAYNSVKNKMHYPLVIAGNGPDEEKLKRLIQSYGLEKQVRLVGAAYGDKKIEFLSHALFVAFPSRHEGFSLFSLEALASGNALLGFDIPGLSWATKEIAMKAKRFNIKDYAQLLLMMQDEKIAATMGRASKQFAKQYSWDAVAKSFISFFHEVLLIEEKVKGSK